MWKLMLSPLPLNGELCRKGIASLPKIGVQRSLICVLGLGLTGLVLHNYIAGFWQKINRYTSVQHLVNIWSLGISTDHQKGATCTPILVFSCWEHWRARCSCYFDQAVGQTIINYILHHLHGMSLIFNLKCEADSRSKISLESLGLTV